MCERLETHTVRGGGVAGGVGNPIRPTEEDGLGVMDGTATGSTRASGSPGTAVHGVEQADNEGAFLSADFIGLPSQLAITIPIGAAMAEASQNGPSRVSRRTLSIARAANRRTLAEGCDPDCTGVIRSFRRRLSIRHTPSRSGRSRSQFKNFFAAPGAARPAGAARRSEAGSQPSEPRRPAAG